MSVRAMQDLPTPEWEREVEAEVQSGQDDDPPEPDEDYNRVTYVALEGVDPTKIDEPERERIEKNIEELILLNHAELSLEGARVITGENGVIEIIETDA